MRSLQKSIQFILNLKQLTKLPLYQFNKQIYPKIQNLNSLNYFTRYNFNQNQQSKIDEYQKNLEAESKKQQELVNLVRIGKIQEGISGMEKLIKERQVKYGEFYPNMDQDYFFLGVSYLDNKDLTKAEQYLNQGMEYCQKTKNVTLLQGFYCSQSQLLLAQKKYEDSIQMIEKAYNLAIEQQNIYALRALQLASQIHQERGDLEKAIQSCEFGIQNAKILQKKFNSIDENLYVQYKLTIEYLHKFESALGHYKIGMGKKEEGEINLKNSAEYKLFLDGLNKMGDGLYYLQTNKPKEALELLTDAKKILKEKKNMHLLSYLMLLWNLGKMGIIKGEFAYGLQEVEEGLNILYKEQDKEYDDIKIDMLNLQCELQINLQNFSDAIKICNVALAQREKSNIEDDRKLATLVIQSVAYWYQNDFDMADKTNDKIIQLSKKLFGETHELTKGFIDRKSQIKEASQKKNKN